MVATRCSGGERLAQVEIGAVWARRTLKAAMAWLRQGARWRQGGGGKAHAEGGKAHDEGGRAPVVSGWRPARRSVVVVVAGRQQHDHHARGLKNEKTAIKEGQ